MNELFTRTELQSIRDRAHEVGEIEGLQMYWESAYNNLAKAASALEAMLERCEITEGKQKGN